MGSNMSLDNKSTIKLLEDTGLSKKEIKKRHKQFLKTYPTGKIKRAEFHLIVKSSNEEIFKNASYEEIDHIFNIYDADSSGEVDFVEFELAVYLFNKSKSPEECIRFCLRCLDLDQSGELEKEELMIPFRRLFRVISNIILIMFLFIF